MAKPGSKLSLKELILILHEKFAKDNIEIEDIIATMDRYDASTWDWVEGAKFDPHRYTRNLIDAGNGKFNLMLLCWNEGQGSGVHDHSDAHCFLKVCHGTIKETRFAWPVKEGQDMVQIGVNYQRQNETGYMADNLGLHRVENANHTDKAITLHLYSPPFESCHRFDQHTGKSTTAKVTFWSQFGVRTPSLGANEVAEEVDNINEQTNDAVDDTKAIRN